MIINVKMRERRGKSRPLRSPRQIDSSRHQRFVERAQGQLQILSPKSAASSSTPPVPRPPPPPLVLTNKPQDPPLSPYKSHTRSNSEVSTRKVLSISPSRGSPFSSNAAAFPPTILDHQPNSSPRKLRSWSPISMNSEPQWQKLFQRSSDGRATQSQTPSNKISTQPPSPRQSPRRSPRNSPTHRVYELEPDSLFGRMAQDPRRHEQPDHASSNPAQPMGSMSPWSSSRSPSPALVNYGLQKRFRAEGSKRKLAGGISRLSPRGFELSKYSRVSASLQHFPERPATVSHIISGRDVHPSASTLRRTHQATPNELVVSAAGGVRSSSPFAPRETHTEEDYKENSSGSSSQNICGPETRGDFDDSTANVAGNRPLTAAPVVSISVPAIQEHVAPIVADSMPTPDHHPTMPKPLVMKGPKPLKSRIRPATSRTDQQSMSPHKAPEAFQWPVSKHQWAHGEPSPKRSATGKTAPNASRGGEGQRSGRKKHEFTDYSRYFDRLPKELQKMLADDDQQESNYVTSAYSKGTTTKFWQSEVKTAAAHPQLSSLESPLPVVSTVPVDVKPGAGLETCSITMEDLSKMEAFHLTDGDWEEIRKRSWPFTKQGCLICGHSFSSRPQLLLSCSHVFHANCLRNYNFLTQTRNCPLCKGLAVYHKEIKRIYDGENYFRTVCVIRLQALVRGFLIRLRRRNQQRQQRRPALEELHNRQLMAVDRSSAPPPPTSTPLTDLNPPADLVAVVEEEEEELQDDEQPDAPKEGSTAETETVASTESREGKATEAENTDLSGACDSDTAVGSPESSWTPSLSSSGAVTPKEPASPQSEPLLPVLELSLSEHT